MDVLISKIEVSKGVVPGREVTALITGKANASGQVYDNLRIGFAVLSQEDWTKPNEEGV
jgi:hypothetical protein|tara:strand:+ start:577 stop:753 length:177 start_codon:yes stop_codon:yes gene_type:complete